MVLSQTVVETDSTRASSTRKNIRISPTREEDLEKLSAYFSALSHITLAERLHASMNAVPEAFVERYLLPQTNATTGFRYTCIAHIRPTTAKQSSANQSACIGDSPIVGEGIVGEGVVGEGILACDLTATQAEIGLSVADDCRLLGVGSKIMTHLIDRASILGLSAVYADTATTNRGFIEFATRHGFTKRIAPHDSTLVRLEKQL